jgi:hypothetical protein
VPKGGIQQQVMADVVDKTFYILSDKEVQWCLAAKVTYLRITSDLLCLATETCSSLSLRDDYTMLECENVSLSAVNIQGEKGRRT